MTSTANHPIARGRSRVRLFVWGAAAVLLLLPAIAMQSGAEGVHWTGSDFVFAGLMLAVACGLYEFAVWLSGDPDYRRGFGLGVFTGLVTVWVNVAVGMFGSEDNVLNLMFAGVLAVAGVGALLARFRAAGMSRAMLAAAVAQLVAAAIGLTVGLTIGDDEPAGFGASVAWEAFLTACVALPWLGSAWLFRRAAARPG